MAERFHWSWDTLDRQDEGRTLRAVAMLNLSAGYSRVIASVEAGNLRGLTSYDWTCYKVLVDLED